MTSPLRRKHLITAPNILETSSAALLLTPAACGEGAATASQHEGLLPCAPTDSKAASGHTRSSQFKKYRSGPVGLFSSMALMLSVSSAAWLCQNSIVRADYDGQNTVTPGTRLVWHPVRPLRADDAAAPATDNTAGGANANCAAATDKHVESAPADDVAPSSVAKKMCEDQQSGDAKLQPEVKLPRVLSTKTGAKNSVVTAGFDDGGTSEPATAKTKIKLAAGQSGAGNANSSVALTDPFGDNSLPSVKTSHQIAMTPPDEIDSLPAPTQNSSGDMRIESVQQDPVELNPPEPMRTGLPKRTVNTYQSQSQIPGPPPPGGAPDLLPNNGQLPNEGEPMLSRQSQRNPAEACKEEYTQIKALTLNKLNIDITPPGNNAKGDLVPFECSLSTDPFVPRSWACTTYTWKASALCHKPLYFEDEALERYGHSWGPWGFEYAQSAVHFFGDLVLLPYSVGVYTPNECIYDLGVYRPGDCAPWICDPFPLSCRGLLTGGVGYGAIALLFP